MTNLTRNTFVDCTCPLINYLPAADWYRGGYDGDPFTDRYQDSTFMFTNATNATATFSINGYGVHIFGAYRQNHGPYEVTINGTSYGEFRTDDADAPKNDAVDALFQIQLFGIESLPEGTHEVTLINRADPEKNKTLIYVDLDFVIWNSTVQSSDDYTVQDNNDTFSYSPSSAWVTDVSSISDFPVFDDGNGHATIESGATVTYDFTGDRVDIYGVVGNYGSIFTAQLDDESSSQFNASRPGYTNTIQLMYQRNNLPNTSHSLTLTAEPEGLNYLSIDYAVVDGADITNSSSSSVSSSSSRLGVGPVAGIAVGCFIGFLLLVLGAFFLWRRRRRPLRVESQTPATSNAHLTPFTPIIDMRTPSDWRSSFGRSEGTTQPYTLTVPSVPTLYNTGSTQRSPLPASARSNRQQRTHFNNALSPEGPYSTGITVPYSATNDPYSTGTVPYTLTVPTVSLPSDSGYTSLSGRTPQAEAQFGSRHTGLERTVMRAHDGGPIDILPPEYSEIPQSQSSSSSRVALITTTEEKHR